MRDFIEALKIFLKYVEKDPYAPFNCTHDLLSVHGVEPSDVSKKDLKRLAKIGFHVGDPHGTGEEHFYSDRYGSC